MSITPRNGNHDSLSRAAVSGAPIFVVGCPRSGTTLLRLMLDSHPSIAIPDESHFITQIPREWRAVRRDPGMVIERVLAHGRFARWGLDPADVRRLAAATRPASYGDTVRAVFAAFAIRHGKTRWGDKSPPYVTEIPFLAGLFPDALFVHIVRDGREVAASLAAHRWGPPSVIGGAGFWKRQVSAGRSAGQALPSARYLEIRFEDLIAHPEALLNEVCDFIGEPFDRAMLEYPETAQQRVWTGDSSTRGAYVDHRNLSMPPSTGLRDWRRGLKIAEQRAVEAAAQPLLGELGYASSRVSRRAKMSVQVDRLRRLPHSAYQLVRGRLRPVLAGYRHRPTRLAAAARSSTRD